MSIKGELRFIETLKKMGQFNPDRLEEIEEALKRGEKYEAMFNDIGKHQYTNIEMEKASIKADYFPEPKKEIVELVKKIDKEMRELLNMCGGLLE